MFFFNNNTRPKIARNCDARLKWPRNSRMFSPYDKISLQKFFLSKYHALLSLSASRGSDAYVTIYDHNVFISHKKIIYL